MSAKNSYGIAFMVAALLISEAARAENAIYQGPCDRAREVGIANSVDKIMKYNSYKSAALVKISGNYEAKCPAETLIYRDLKLKSRTSQEVSFDLTQITIKIGKENNPSTCERLHLWDKAGYGTVKFRLQVDKLNEICEVVLYGDWHIKSTAVSSYDAKFGGRVIMLNDGNMVMAQASPQGSTYFAPITFMGY